MSVVAGVVGELDPDRVSGEDACVLLARLSRLCRLAEGGRTLLAPRIESSGVWRTRGHRTPADLLASLEGGTIGRARTTLETGRRLAGLPATEAAVRAGRLTPEKATVITGAATLDPAAESSLLAGVDEVPLVEVRTRCAEVRATSARHDPLAAHARIHAARSFSSWVDGEGAFCFSGRDTLERGALLTARLQEWCDRSRRAEARAAGTGATRARSGAPDTARERARRADAFFALVTGVPTGERPEGAAGTTATPTTATPSTATPTTATPTTEPTPWRAIVRVDLAALRAGRARPGEVCELAGLGPVPVPVAASLLSDSFLAVLFHEADEIVKISHPGRTINQRLRTALAERDRGCVVPGCTVTFGLEIDHVVPWAHGGPTALANLATLCHFHHQQKTLFGYVLTRHGPPAALRPTWTFAPPGATGPPRPGPRATDPPTRPRPAGATGRRPPPPAA